MGSDPNGGMTDEEYLRDYVARYNDPRFVAGLSRIDADAVATRWEAAGTLAPVDRERFLKELRSVQSLDALCFEYPRGIQQRTLDLVSSHRHRVDKVPVGLIGKYTLNGSVRKAPSGGEIIVLNAGIVTHMGGVAKLATGFIFYDREPETYGAYPRRDFGNSIYCLARDLVEPNGAWASKMPLATFMVSRRPDFVNEVYVQRAQNLVLLHEYGHIVRGHMEGVPFYEIGPESEKSIASSEAHQHEYEADEFAIDCLRETCAEQAGWSQIAYSTALFFRFADLRDAVFTNVTGIDRRQVESHPPAVDRWHRMKRHFASDSIAFGAASAVDAAFDIILETFGLGEPESRSLRTGN